MGGFEGQVEVTPGPQPHSAREKIIIDVERCEGEACKTSPTEAKPVAPKPHPALPAHRTEAAHKPPIGGECHLPQVSFSGLDFNNRSWERPGKTTPVTPHMGKADSDTWNPGRPPGLAEVTPGFATTDHQKDAMLDARSSQVAKLPDGSTVYSYEGKLAHWGWGFSNWDTKSDLSGRFTAQELVDKEGKLLSSSVQYADQNRFSSDSNGVHINFSDDKGGKLSFQNVTRVDTERTCDGTYKSTVTTANHGSATFTLDQTGQVTKVERHAASE